MTSPSIHSVRQWAGNHGPALQGLSAPLLVVAILALMVLPVPPWMLDTFFTLNIAVALMVMMVAAYMIKPLDFAAFPSVLLLTTLMR
ncbi:MAG: FHIPEP family type III secretion protein, partial [Diaphorobacter nitroreducens]